MKKNNLKLSLSILAVLLAFTMKAQMPDTTGLHTHSWTCGNDSIMFSNLKDTVYQNSMARYNAAIAGSVASSSNIIPVVFHIITPPSYSITITYDQIKWAVASLNAQFSGPGSYSLFTGQNPGAHAANTFIEFRLACTPMPASGTNTATINGLAGWTNANEPGVVRYNTSVSAVLNQAVVDPTSPASSYTPMISMTNPTGFFPQNDYLNIYCVPNIAYSGSGTVLGFSTFPFPSWTISSGGLTMDGIIMRLDCIGSNEYPNGFPMFSSNFDKGVTLAHEAGHYLGLYHTFQPQDASGDLTVSPFICWGETYSTATTEGDLVYDTPPTKINGDLGNILVINSCMENYAPYGFLSDENDQLENYMCYSDENKRNTFTSDQAGRMAGTFTASPSRANLVSPINLAATGVDTWPTSCAAYTGIVTGIFNTAIAPNSTCSSIIMQFTNPSTNDFNTPNTTTYSWIFGDGGTSTSANPTHIYTTQNTFTVSCTATNGTVTNTYTNTVNTDFNVSIVGQSGSSSLGTGSTATTTSATVCKGTEQTIYVYFGSGIPSAIITDGINSYTVTNYMYLGEPEVIPYLLTPLASASYSLVPASCGGVSRGTATFNVIDCCPTLISDGDFESFTPGEFITQALYTPTVIPNQFGSYDVDNVGSGYFGLISPFNPATGNFLNVTGKVMQVDGFYGNNTIVNITDGPDGCTNTSDLPIVWQQTVTALQPSTDYFYSFKIMENYSNYACSGGLKFSTSISSSTFTLLPTQTFTPAIDNYVSTAGWVVYTYTFTTPTNTAVPSNTFFISINQVNTFHGQFFDFLLDNITFQPMTPSIQAVGNATLSVCTGTTTPLSATVNCGASLSDYSYVWSPSGSVACYTCTTTSASPTTTTIYTLVATSTLTGEGAPPPIISTVTVTIDPAAMPTLSVTPTNTALCAGQTATLTASSSASTYTWSTGANTASITVTPTVATIYTVTSTNTVTGCANTQTVSVTISPSILVIPASPTICLGQNVILTAGGADTYTWSPSSTLSCSVCANPIATPTTTTIYSVTGTNTLTSCSNTQTVNVTLNPSPVISSSVLPSPICVGTTETITISGADTYTWSTGATGSTLINTPTTSGTKTVTVTGTYTATGCTNSQTLSFTINPLPVLTETFSPSLPVCTGVTLTVTASGASTYSWTGGATGSTVTVTPTSTGTKTLTVTGTSAYGCISVLTQTAQVYATPTVAVAASPTLICAGQPATLTASGTGASTYSWSPSGSLNSSTGTTVTATPSLSTTYSVVGTSTAGCTNTASVTLTVNSAPTLSVVASPTAICAGNSSTLTATGADTYSWTPSTGLSGTTGSTVTATPSVTTTYSVVGTSTAGCTHTTPITLTVKPVPTLTVTTRITTLCGDEDGSDITASGANTYSWSPSSTLDDPTSDEPYATPTVTTTYSVTGTNTLTGCTATNTITLTVATNSCAATSIVPTYSPTSSYTLSGNPIYVSSDINVSGINYVINSSDVRIKPGVSIHVAYNGTLTVIGSWLHSCATCNSGSWSGISVDGGGTVNMISGSTISHGTVVATNNIIEDAETAIHFNASSTAATWSITNTIFNKNEKGIWIDHNTANLSANKISNCVFTCRNFGSHILTQSNWNNIVTNIKAATTQSLSTSNPLDLTLDGSRAWYGIEASNTNTLTPVAVGNATLTANIFDNLDVGILDIAAGLTVQNNRFQNLTGNTADAKGIGIYSNMSGTPTASLTVGGSVAAANTFTNCLIGITTYSANRVYIDYNNFNNEVTAPASTATVSPNLVIGYAGVYQTQYAATATTSTAESMSFTNNNIQNCNVGHYLDIAKPYNTGDASTSISTNTITAAGTSSQYCNYGIWLQQSLHSGAGSTSVPQDAIFINNNSITNQAINSIYVSTVTTPTTATKGFVQINGNTELSIQYTTAATSTVIPHRAAVYVTGSNYIKIDNNTNIKCTGLSSYSGSDAQYLAGIYISGSSSSMVNCNTVNYMGEDFVWEGTSINSQWYKNTMQYSRFGLVLRNSGIMGDQKSLNHPSGNIFGKHISTNITDAHTLADNSNPGISGSTSKLFVLSSPVCGSATTYSPCQNNGTNAYSASTISVTTGSFPCVCVGDCGSGRMAYNSTMSDSTMSAADSVLLVLEGILNGIENGDPYPVYDLQTRWSLQYYVATQNDSLPAATGYENAKTMAQADAALSGDNYAAAQTLLNSVSSTNVLEDNWLLVDNLLIKLHNDTLDSADVLSLNTVAIQCPLVGGNIVYEARALLNNYYKHIVTYADNCDDNGNNSRKTDIQTNATLSKKVNFKIYPNPSLSYDELNVAYFNIESNQAVSIKISDLEGRIVYENSFTTTDDKVFKVRGTYTAGTYFVNITTANGVVETHKLVIMPK